MDDLEFLANTNLTSQGVVRGRYLFSAGESGADLADVKGHVTMLEPLVADVAELKARVGKLEDHAARQRRNEAGVLVMMRGTAGLFDERVSRLEADVAALKPNG